MHRSLIWIAAALAAVAVAGCGSGGSSDDPPESRPDDFAFTVVHSDGSVAPPYHAEWSVEVDAEGNGLATYTPDYSGEDVPTYKAKFEVSDEDMDRIYAEMRDAGLLEEIEPADDPPIGGSTETARIYADGETFDVPAFDSSGGETLGSVADSVRGLVPGEDWKSFERKRAAYVQQEYGQELEPEAGDS